MVLAELRQLAGELNIPDTSGMRRNDLIAAIKERQAGGKSGVSQGQLALAEDAKQESAGKPAGGAPESNGAGHSSAAETGSAPSETARSDAGAAKAEAPKTEAAPSGDPAKTESAPSSEAAKAESPSEPVKTESSTEAVKTESAPSADAVTSADAPADGAEAPARPSRRRRAATRAAGAPNANADGETAKPDTGRSDAPKAENGKPAEADKPDAGRADGDQDGEGRGGRDGGRGNRDREGGNRDRDRDNNRDRDNRDRDNNRDRDRGDNRDRGDDDEDGGGRRRGRRFRDRNRRGSRDRREGGGGGGGGNTEPELRDDDVLTPVAGILDVLDNYAFVRTTGYLSGPDDVYVSLSMVRRHGLRRGDHVAGVVRQPREGEQQRQKFNPLVRVDSINWKDPEVAKKRPEFTKLTPLYPNERLRLETESHKLTTRVIDLVMPIGKGQRALIVSPPKAGKTMILQAIANAITTNNPECHLMVVLVDERPEEVTDMQRSVKGEVIASTFDRPPSDHTTVAELSIERAKRLVEEGQDVVVLLDSITRLGRAYNLAAPASGRILSGGVDSTALYPPKRFLGAARNIENGGSLTIFATALVETGSTMDTVIFEEFKGTGNAELKLDRRIADKRVFPAIDIDASGTRKEELLLAPDEMAITVKLRRVLSALDDQQALDLVLTQLRKTRTNAEFLMQVSKNTPNVDDRD
ncbi:transcription termination factor Rho [Pseudonocardia eucalypti]